MLIPWRPERSGRATLRVAEAVAEAAEEVDHRLDARQEHEDRAQHTSGHRHNRHWLHGLVPAEMEANLRLRQSLKSLALLADRDRHWRVESERRRRFIQEDDDLMLETFHGNCWSASTPVETPTA